MTDTHPDHGARVRYLATQLADVLAWLNVSEDPAEQEAAGDLDRALDRIDSAVTSLRTDEDGNYDEDADDPECGHGLCSKGFICDSCGETFPLTPNPVVVSIKDQPVEGGGILITELTSRNGSAEVTLCTYGTSPHDDDRGVAMHDAEETADAIRKVLDGASLTWIPDAARVRFVAEYDEWSARRQELSDQEATDHPPGDAWHGSDDSAVELLELAAALIIREAPSEPTAYTVDGKPVVRVVVDCTVGSTADEQALANIAEVLAERMGDNLDNVLGVNDLMVDHSVERWHVRAELATGDDVDA